MRYRMFVGSGFALGFLAGAWAGRDRYDTVMRRLRGMKDNPSVHATAGLLHAHAAGAVGSAKRAVTVAAVTPVSGRGPDPSTSTGRNGARPDPETPPSR